MKFHGAAAAEVVRRTASAPPRRSVLHSVMVASVLLLATTAVTVTASGSQSERELLQEFYTATNGASWNANTGWEDNSNDPCAWFGVICQGEAEAARMADDDSTSNNATRYLLDLLDEEEILRELATISDTGTTVKIPNSPKGSVIGLKLKNNNIVGRVPVSLWDLPNLRVLELSDNPVDIDFTGRSDTLIQLKMHRTSTGSLTGIERFPNLLELHMSETKLGDVQFPDQLFKLTNLVALHMAKCQLEGSFPSQLGLSLPNLRELNVFDNEFFGVVPNSLSNLVDMRLLTLSRNHFEGRIPEWLDTFTALEELYLSENQFTGTLPSFANHPNMYRLYLDHNALVDNIPADFLASTVAPDDGSTIHVNLDANQLGAIVPDTLDNLESLPLKITIAGNQFVGYASQALCDNTLWMDGMVADFGCEAIACPLKTAATLGRRTATQKCNTCNSATFLGQMTCMDQDDEKTLRTFYQTMGGDHWKRNDGWMKEGVPVCQWYGVTCYGSSGADAKHFGRVKRLELHNNGLIGPIPNIIFALSMVTWIDLSWNKISFPFDDLHKTPNLHILNIGHTDTTSLDGIQEGNTFFNVFMADALNIDGMIPKQLFSNTNLEVLSLNNCRLTGTIGTELGHLTKLRELYLWGNDLHGSIPTQVGSLTDLRILTLAQNQLTGTLPAALEQLSNLKAFSVKDQLTKGGGISGELLPFQYNPSMTDLFLSGNKFAGSIPATMLNNVNTDTTLLVDLSNNQLTGTVPASLGKFTQMDLFAADNYITKVDDQLCGKNDWMYGAVEALGCDAILCPAFTANPLGRLAFDNMACNDCGGDINEPLMGQTQCGGKESIMTERQILELLYNECGGKDWINRANWLSSSNYCDWYGVSCDDARSVVTIVLGSNNLKGIIPTALFSLPNLKRLSLFGNEIDFLFGGIEYATNLRSLVLDNIKMSALTGVGNARGLTELTVRANNLSGPLPDELASLNSLEQLILSENRFTGTLPEWLNRLNNLQTLMLGSNKFKGPLLPFDVYNKISLLSLHTNQLTGTIPEDFLRSAPADDKLFVDLSNNRLVGTVPYTLGHINLLSLQIKANRISEIPQELCQAESAWNDYDVKDFGCDGLACPAGTYNPKGRQSESDSPCMHCRKAKYMGTTNCSPATKVLTMSVTSTIATAVVLFMTMW